MEITIWDEQSKQLSAMSTESGESVEKIINSAINEYYKNFIAEMKRLEIHTV